MSYNSEQGRRFVAAMAFMVMDGEEVDGEEFFIENDDAWATLQRLIFDARLIMGVPQYMSHGGGVT